MSKKVIAIAGPTAVGKTKFAIEAAKFIGGEIVSCDSMQLYKYMDIGSAKPTKEELAQVPHHLVDIIDPREPFSVYEYQKLAKEAISDIHSRGLIPVISGGTGLYFNSIIYDMDFTSDSGDLKYRKELKDLADVEGKEAVYKLLVDLDPKTASEIHPNNLKRTIRALERIHEGEKNVRSFKNVNEENKEYDIVLIVLTRDRAELYDRINKRVMLLIEAGLVDEVKRLMDMGLTSDDISMKGIGYKEIMAYLDGEYDLDTAIDIVQKNTRHYAKRQLTWYRRYDKIRWLDITACGSDENAIEVLKSWLEKEI